MGFITARARTRTVRRVQREVDVTLRTHSIMSCIDLPHATKAGDSTCFSIKIRLEPYFGQDPESPSLQ